MLRPIKLTLLFVFIFIRNTAFSQTIDTLPGRYRASKLDSLDSKILKQRRYIQVFLPEHYEENLKEKYDVLYVLDGGVQNAGLITQIQAFIERQGFMPPTIIVSIIPIDRNKELTPTHLAIVPGSGDAAEFLNFVKSELVPYVTKTYPSNGDNTLWGHSLSGLFVLYTLLNSPSTFKSYIAVDPSAWWDNHYITKIKSHFSDQGSSPLTLFVGGREGLAFNDMGTDSLKQMLKSIPQRTLNWKVLAYPGETHSSVAFKTTYDGLKFTYEGYAKALHFHPMHGIIRKDSPFKIWFSDDTSHVHYTTDGSTPTLLSPKMHSELMISGPKTLIFKEITNRARYDKVDTGRYVEGVIAQEHISRSKLQAGGFKYSYFEGNWNKWPDLKNKTPNKVGLADNEFLLSDLPKKNHYALVIEGIMEITEEGNYMFSLDADSNSTLYLGNKPLIAWTGSTLSFTTSCTVYLQKGFYPYKVNYLHNNTDFNLELEYLTPGKTKPQESQPIPTTKRFVIKEH